MCLKFIFQKVIGVFNAYDKSMNEFHKELGKMDPKVQARVYASMFTRR